MQSSSVSPREWIAESHRSRLSGVEALARRKPYYPLTTSFRIISRGPVQSREPNDVSIMRAARGRVRMNHHKNGIPVNDEIVNEPRMFARSARL